MYHVLKMSLVNIITPTKCNASSTPDGVTITLTFPVDPLNPITSPLFIPGDSIEVSKFMYSCNYTYMSIVYPNTYISQPFNGGQTVLTCTDSILTFTPTTPCIIVPPTSITAVSYTTTVVTFTLVTSVVIPVNIAVNITGVKGVSSGINYVNSSSAGSFTILMNSSTSGTIPVTSALVTVKYTSGVVSTFKPPPSINTTAATGDGSTVTLTYLTQNFTPYQVGDFFTVSGLDPAIFNGIFRCTHCTTTQLQYLLNTGIDIGPQVTPGRIIANYPFGAYPLNYVYIYDHQLIEWHFADPLATNAFMNGTYFDGYKGFSALFVLNKGSAYSVDMTGVYTITGMNEHVSFYASPGDYTTVTQQGSVLTNNPNSLNPPFIPGQTLQPGGYANAI